MAFTLTFPTQSPVPSSEEIAEWLTLQGEPFDTPGPHTLALKALPVRLLVNPVDQQMLAQLDVSPTTSLPRMVDLMFAFSVRVGADVRLAGVGPVRRGGLWLRLAEEQDRARIAVALARADEHGRHERIVKRMWGVVGQLLPGRDVRWDSGREQLVELLEVGEGISVEDAAWHKADARPGDVVTVPVDGTPHVTVWRWLSTTYPALLDH